MKKLFVLMLMLLPGTLFSQSSGDFDSRVEQGIKQIYNIKFDEADRTFKSVIADYPNQPAGKFFLAMIDWWKIMLDLDNEGYDDIFFAKLEDVIYQCDQILEKDESNVDALFFKGGAIGFRGRLRAMRESWIKAADDGREALPIVNRAYKLNPNNIDVQLGFGIYDYYAAVIPQKYPMIKPLMVFFPSGDKDKGIKELTNVALNGKYAKTESRYFLMQLYYQFEENFQKAEEFAKLLNGEFPDNPIFERYFGRINVRKGDYSVADRIFRDVYDKSSMKYAGYNDVARREATYYLGYYKKLMGQVDSAIVYFRECEQLSRKVDRKEKSGFLVNSLLYLGNYYDQLGQRDKAITNYKELLDIKEFGQSHTLAKQYLEKPYGK
ncbi:MAG: tetratricopeptide repeat protein [Ignavibacteriales bacterium]